MSEYVIGFDVGGTRLKSGAVLRDGTLVEAGVRASGFNLRPEKVIEALIEEAARIRSKLGAAPHHVGIGFPGAVKPDQGIVLMAGKLDGMEGYPIVPEVQEAIGVPVIADNDGRLSMVAEKAYGLARDESWVVAITIGTGVGSGVMLDGRILRDPRLQFGTQLSHMVMDTTNKHICITGAQGTGDMICSATALTTDVRSILARGIPSVLSERYFDDPFSVDFKSITAAAEAGDRVAVDELGLWTEKVAWLFVSAVHLYSPELITLGGGAANAAHLFIDRVREHVNNHTFRYPKNDPVRIELSELGDHAGVLGAGALAWQTCSSTNQTQ